MSRRHRIRTGGIALVVALALAGAVVPGTLAAAAPSPTVEQVGAQVDALREQAEVATEQYNAQQESIASLQLQVGAAQARIAGQRAAVEQARRALGQLAADTYEAGDLATLSLFLGDNPDARVAAGGLMTSLGDRRAQAIQELRHQRQVLLGTMTDLQAQQQRLQQAQKQVAASKADVESKLAAATRLLDQLSAPQRRQLAAATQAKETASLAGAGVTVPASGHVTCQDVTIPIPDDRVAKVIQYACSKLGDPYRWGGSGPGSFDCSGLTMMAWKQAGVMLPHNAQTQASAGTTVSRSALRVGDLVFFFSPIEHVGIYIGDGLIIHAPKTGDVVKIAPIFSGYATAARF